MEIYVYSDESGVFDKKHNDIFVYGGLIFLSEESRDIAARKYLRAEKSVRSNKYSIKMELKACKITNSEKGKLYRSMNQYIKFGAIINQKNVIDQIFTSKKDKQRYLDYAYKIALKRAFQNLIKAGLIIPENVNSISVFNDEHSTATNGRYELREGLEQEFKLGTYNMKYDKFYPPIFPKLLSIDLDFCNSEKKPLIRASDIIANQIFFAATNRKFDKLNKIYITTLP